MSSFKFSILFLLCFCIFSNTDIYSQSCSVTFISSMQVGSSNGICTYSTVLTFSASNTNSANSITITSQNSNITSVTNPSGETDSAAPFSFTSGFGGNYTISHSASCNQGSTTFTFNYDGPGNGDCIISSPSVTLPVTFSYYRIDNTKQNGKSFLSFTTASETNNDYFTIERSGNGKSCDEIGTIDGAGNSSKEISYEFVDEKPLAGINYYRIKQTDFDGRFTYSEIRSVRFKGLNNVNVTPRTTEGQINITTDLEAYTIDIHNAAGQVVKTFPAMGLDQTISIESLVAGVYYIRINSGTESETLRVIKL